MHVFVNKINFISDLVLTSNHTHKWDPTSCFQRFWLV